MAPTQTPMPPSRRAAASMVSSVRSSPIASGRRPANGGCLHERGNRTPLVDAGRPHLEHHLARLNVKAIVAGDDLVERGADDRAQLRVGAIVHGDRHALVFDEQFRMARGEGREPRPYAVEGGAGDRLDRATGQSQLGAMRAGGGEMRGGEQPVERRDRAAGNDRDRTAGAFRQTVEHRRQVGRHDDPVRGFGEIDQRAIDVEKEGPAVG